MAFKAIILLKRKDELSRQGFADWWLKEHAPLAAKLPGLRRFCFNLATDEDAAYDGVSELWFDSKADFEAAYQSETGRAVAADSMEHVSRRDRILVEEHDFEPAA